VAAWELGHVLEAVQPAVSAGVVERLEEAVPTEGKQLFLMRRLEN